MDAFYASVEQRDNPELKGCPIAVGNPEGRGVVAAASYEARKFGVRSAMPSVTAKRLCPQLIFVEGDFSKYKRVSQQMHEIFHEYTDIIEPISLDEAFLDVTVNKKNIELAVEIAKEIKIKIKERLKLVASAGVSYNKFLAKIASDYRKPDGLCTIHPSTALQFIDSLPIEAFWGIGPVTAKRMHNLGISTGLDLRNTDEDFLKNEFGKAGVLYHNFSLGIDDRPVEAERIRKSVGCETTLENDISNIEDVEIIFNELADDLIERLKRNNFKGMTFTLKVKHSDFIMRTRSVSFSDSTWTKEKILSSAYHLLNEIEIRNHPVRLFGFSVSRPDNIEEKANTSSFLSKEKYIFAKNSMGLWRQLKINFND